MYFRSDKTWQPEPRAPIDYCYVRPQHIPSVNALCGEFFWPGIDCKIFLHKISDSYYFK